MANIRQIADELVAQTSEEVKRLNEQLHAQYDIQPCYSGGFDFMRGYKRSSVTASEKKHRVNTIQKRRKKNKNKKTHRRN